MRVLVTGGAGFIGAAAVRELLAQGHAVTVFDDLSAGFRENLPAEARLIVGDLCDRDAVVSACASQAAVLHLGAFVSVPLSIQQPARCHAVNVDGTRHVYEAACRAGAGRVVIASTAAVYGIAPALPTHEGAPADPASPYAATKLASERLADGRRPGVDPEFVALRFFNVYGPRQRHDSPYAGVVAKALERIAADEVFTIDGDGWQSRDFIYVGDVARAAVAALTRPGLDGQVINVGRGVESSVRDLVASLGRVTGNAPRLAYGPGRPGDARRSVADVSRMHALLDFKADVGLDEGLARLYAWSREAAHA